MLTYGMTFKLDIDSVKVNHRARISFESYHLGTHPHITIRSLYLTTKVLSGITAFVAAF